MWSDDQNADDSAEMMPMENGYIMGCPECSMGFGMNSPLNNKGEHYECANNPQHRFRIGEDGFLKSI